MTVDYCKHNYPVNSDCPECDRDQLRERNAQLEKQLAASMDETEGVIAKSIDGFPGKIDADNKTLKRLARELINALDSIDDPMRQWLTPNSHSILRVKVNQLRAAVMP